jgi:putative transposase
MLLSVPPKYAVAQVVGYLKGKSAIYLARTFGGRRQNFTGQHFWARGYYVSTAGKDEEAVRQYIRNQEEADQRLDQLRLPTAILFPPDVKVHLGGWVTREMKRLGIGAVWG